MSDREQVQPGEILQKALGTRAPGRDWIRQLEPLQRVGLWLALAFFAYILIATGTIFLCPSAVSNFRRFRRHQ
jgi:hypothetical protein